MLGIQGRFTRRFCHIVVAGLFVTAIGSFDRDGRADDSLGVQVPDGFEVSLYAGDDLAHDIYSMTVDSQGRVVVSGAGYVRILIDADGDGRAESYQEFVDGPRTGAQGMYHLGSDLLCSGDAGLLRYRDRNRDDRADGPPDVFLKIHAGNEHDLHAIRKGPDGWWYVIAGNMAGVTSDYINLPASPVKSPQAGTVMRFTPDLSRGEVIADGLRNAYDFDFSSAGDLFTFDSDGERDMSLPWYRPTRVFHVLPGMSHGWFSRSWKRPDTFFDMPPAVAEFGRGSPTGVCCYRHDQFPAEYQGALFVLDWTYGRVWALPLEKSGSSWATQPIDFMQAVGQHGFAPTDAVVGPDGSLFVCVGGRGTQGAVYRIRSKTPPPQRVAVAMRHDASPKDQLDFCLRMPQPLSSWARQRWEPIAHNLKAEPFIRAALDTSRPAHERVRAIEILTEKFGGLDSEMVARLRTDEHPQIRARTIWALGRSNPDGPDASQLAKAFEDSDPHVVRTAVETLVGAESAVLDAYAKSLPEALGHSDRYIRALSGTVLSGMSPDAFQQTVPPAIQKGWAAAVPVAIAYARLNEGKYVNYPVEVGLRILRGKHGQARKLEAARVIEVALGDVGPDGPEHAPVFDGYVSQQDLSAYERELDALRIALAEIYPTGDAVVDLELLRVIAMAQPANDQLVDAIAGQLTDESDPILDIHRLITLARLPVIPSPTARGSIAAALVNLDAKIESRGLIQDSNWDDRVLEMYSALVQRDPQLAIAILEHPKFGEPAHIAFLGEFPPERFEDVLGTFLRRIREENDYEWTPDVIYLLAASGDPELMSRVREMFHDPSLRNAVLLSLSEMPEEVDRPLYVEGLNAAPPEVLTECLKALALLSPSEDAAENVTLVNTLRKLSPEGGDLQLRDQVAELLKRNLRQDFGYRLAQEGAPQRAAVESWSHYVEEQFPEEYARQLGTSAEGIEELKELLASVDWSAGDPQRGAEVFRQQQCSRCHGGRRALGPDLAGVTSRFSRDDLFTAIVFPHRDVSPRYQTVTVATTEGRVHTGLVVYESVDGLVLRDSTNRTFRFETSEIESKRTSTKSLMPEGLVKNLTPADLANLYAYLRDQSVQTASAESTTGED